MSYYASYGSLALAFGLHWGGNTVSLVFWYLWKFRWDGVVVNLPRSEIYSHGRGFNFFYVFNCFNLLTLGTFLFW